MPDLVSPYWAMAHSPIQMIYIQITMYKIDYFVLAFVKALTGLLIAKGEKQLLCAELGHARGFHGTVGGKVLLPGIHSHIRVLSIPFPFLSQRMMALN